ncbi:MAG: hypothetical protein A3H97_18810, partial [Acidobacteria bacterium RIFCSPLOWO2_02_FULL_65_29]
MIVAGCGIRATALTALLALSSASPAIAQQSGGDASGDPQAPIAPAVVSRGENGRIVVRAVRVAPAIRVDGRLDEAVYGATPSIGDFIQTLPNEGEPATEKSDVWVLYDDNYMYVTCRCWDSAPPEEWFANEMRRDGNQMRDNDTFGVMFDTFHDRRNAFVFYTNPLGALSDQTYTDEGNPNRDWNPVWDVRTGRFEGGWTVEMAIPFKTLRYTSGVAQTWGVQFRRSIRRKNEWAHLAPLPASLGGSTAWFRVSGAATLVGLDLPTANKNVELKPYGISRFTTDRLRASPDDFEGDFGVDAKYGITANLTADVTYNTDFAQVEVDEQQVNLTRFALSFPEKRDFFLEGRGIFDFGRGGNVSGGGTNIPGGGGGGGEGGAGGITPQLFYSRRIGLNRNRVIPIDVGGRVTGKVGNTSLGLLNIQTGDHPGDDQVPATPTTNFTVARVKRDILRRSSIGALVTNRSSSVAGDGSNQAVGVDGAFSFFQNVAMGGYYARSKTPDLDRDADSYQGRFNYAADRYGARVEYLKVGDHFNPEVGLVRRDDFKRSFGSARFSPRPRGIRAVRRFLWEGSFENFENGAGLTETRVWTGRFNTEFETSDQFNAEVNNNREQLVQPFEVVSGVVIPVGDYHFRDGQVSYYFGPQRRMSGNVSLQFGQFYDGTITTVGLSGSRVSLRSQWSLEPSLSINRVKLPHGDFTTRLLRLRTDYGFSPRMFTGALLQYNSTDNTFSSNLRFRWEYHPGSELFVVYTDERDTSLAGFPGLRNRAFVVKVNRLW